MPHKSSIGLTPVRGPGVCRGDVGWGGGGRRGGEPMSCSRCMQCVGWVGLGCHGGAVCLVGPGPDCFNPGGDA